MKRCGRTWPTVSSWTTEETWPIRLRVATDCLLLTAKARYGVLAVSCAATEMRPRMVRLTKAQIAEKERLEKSKRRAHIAGLVIGVSGLLVGIAALVFGTTISDAVTKPSGEAKTRTLLSSLHAGDTEASFTSVLGEATSKRVIADSPWTYSVFVKEAYAVSAVSDAEGQVVVFSVLSCNPKLEPEFTTKSQTVVLLNDQPLTLAETVTSKSPSADAPNLNDRTLYYQNGGSGRQMSQYLELTRDGERSGNDYHLYALGLSGQCNDDNLPDLNSSPYSGAVGGAPSSVQEFREKNAPNFYTDIDTQYDFHFEIDDHGYGVFTDFGTEPETVISGVPLSLHGGEVPVDFGK